MSLSSVKTSARGVNLNPVNPLSIQLPLNNNRRVTASSSSLKRSSSSSSARKTATLNAGGGGTTIDQESIAAERHFPHAFLLSTKRTNESLEVGEGMFKGTARFLN